MGLYTNTRESVDSLCGDATDTHIAVTFKGQIQTGWTAMKVGKALERGNIPGTRGVWQTASAVGAICTCMFNYVFYMPSSLPLLHTAMLTPCLNAFWHSDPYICLHFLGNVFLSCTIYKRPIPIRAEDGGGLIIHHGLIIRTIR